MKNYKEKANEVYTMPSTDTTLEKRMANILDVLKDKYFEEYTDNNYNPNITASDNLSSDNKNFKLLERMADYLITSDEGRTLNKEDSENKAFLTESLNKKITREHVSGYIDDSSGNGGGEETYVPNTGLEYKNVYPSSSVKINEDDLTNPAIKELSDLYESIDNHEGYTKRHKDRMKYFVMADMIAIKKSANQIPEKCNKSTRIRSSKMLLESSAFNFLDFTNPDTVKAMIKMGSVPSLNNNNDDAYIAVMDFHNIVSRADLNDEEVFLFDRLQEGYTFADMERTFGVNAVHYRKYVQKNLINKIVAQGERYDSNDIESPIYKKEEF